MKLFLDYFPIIGFFIVYKTHDVITATAALMGFTLIQVAGFWLYTKKVEKLHIVTLVMALVFGGLTLAFNDPLFLKWKVSLFFWLIAITLLVRQLFFKLHTLSLLLGKVLPTPSAVPDALWRKIDFIWITFFTVFGFINLYVAFQLSLDTWVNFKVWGLLICQMVVFIYTFFLLHPYMEEENEPQDNDKP